MKPQQTEVKPDEIVKVPPALRRNGPHFRSWLPKALKALRENPVGIQSDETRFCIVKRDKLDAMALVRYAKTRGVKLSQCSAENGWQIFVKG